MLLLKKERCKMSIKRTGLVVVGIVLLLLIVLLVFQREIVGRFFDKINVTSDSYEILVDENLQNDLYIYWYGEAGFNNEYNRILIYHKDLLQKNLPSYGPNKFLIKYKDLCHNSIGIWKTIPYATHNYKIKISKRNNDMIISWNIQNWYDPDIITGQDTVRIQAD